ncbi:MAG TPA: hotdog domain-containing protein, partial [Anaerolineales bacterium]|nr:hotdog domain-containing protein [Anaerolineales bacterium]
TVSVDSFVFREPIKIGDLVTLTAEVTYAGRTSMEAEVQVVAENPVTGERTHTNTAYLVYVALDDNNKPITVPPLVAGTGDEKLRLEQGKMRQQRRIAQKQSS